MNNATSKMREMTDKEINKIADRIIEENEAKSLKEAKAIVAAQSF